MTQIESDARDLELLEKMAGGNTCSGRALQKLRSRLEQLEAERDAILDALPDNATCKHPETGESLLDNIRDLVADSKAYHS